MANGFGNRFLRVCVRVRSVCRKGTFVRDLAPRLTALRRHISARRQAKSRGTTMPGVSGRGVSALSEGKSGSWAPSRGARLRSGALRWCMRSSTAPGSPGVPSSPGLALWRYCEQSAQFIFGESTGDPVADRILRALRDAPDGLTRTEIRDVFGRNEKASTIQKALRVLEEYGLAGRRTITRTGGRASERWFALGV